MASIPNTSMVSWSFTALPVPTDVPFIEDQVPSPGAIGQVLQPVVSFTVFDVPHDIDLTTLDVTIDGGLAVDNGVIQAGWSGSVTPVTYGYAVSVSPDVAFAKNAIIPVQVDVDHDDPTPAPQTFNWSFDTVSENLTFTMRADKFQGGGPIGFVFWSAPDAPDPTGALSPYSTGDLQDIVVMERNQAATNYTMRAYDTINLEHVFWTGPAPDPTAINAPVPAGQLIDILVGGTSFIDSPVTLGPVPANLLPVLGTAFSFIPSVDNPAGGVVTFALPSGVLPDGLSLNTSTGEISGTPTITGLLTSTGLYTGLTLSATNGVQTDVSTAFTIDVQGAQIPGPDLYIPADTDGNDASGQSKPNPTVTLVNFPGGNGNISGAADFAFATSKLDYGDDVDYRVNGNAALTISATVNPDTIPSTEARIAQHSDEIPNGTGWEFFLDQSSGGQLGFRARHGTADSLQQTTATLGLGSFSQVSTSFVAANARADLYVDGVAQALATDTAGSGALGDDTGEVLVVGNRPVGSREWEGGIDEFALWTSEFSADQHATLGWLKLRGTTIIAWANQSPTAVSYADREVTVLQPMTLSPTLPAVDPEAAVVTYAIASGTLPPAVSFDPANGVFSGTPTIATLLGGSPVGDYTLTVEGDDGFNTTESAPFTISVRGVELPDPVFYGPMDTDGLNTIKALFPTNTNVTFPGGGNGQVADAGDWAAVDSVLDHADHADFRVDGNAFLTASAIINPRSFPNSLPRILDHDNGGSAGWLFATQSTGEVQVNVRYSITQGRAITTATLPTSQFTQVAFEWSAGAARSDIYIAGILAPLGTDTTGAGALGDDTGEALLIGNDTLTTRYFDGNIDEVAIWTSALTSLQHATIGWLAARGESLASWIRDEAPVGPTYNNQVIETEVAASFTPVEDGYDPEGQTVTYPAAYGLPPGLTLNQTTGEVSGTPTGVGPASVMVSVSDGMNVVDGPLFNIMVEFGAAGDVVDSFEFADSWPDTIANPFPDAVFATSTVADSFDNLDGWPGT